MFCLLKFVRLGRGRAGISGACQDQHKHLGNVVVSVLSLIRFTTCYLYTYILGTSSKIHFSQNRQVSAVTRGFSQEASHTQSPRKSSAKFNSIPTKPRKYIFTTTEYSTRKTFAFALHTLNVHKITTTPNHRARAFHFPRHAMSRARNRRNAHCSSRRSRAHRRYSRQKSKQNLVPATAKTASASIARFSPRCTAAGLARQQLRKIARTERGLLSRPLHNHHLHARCNIIFQARCTAVL